jgi:uncharacterized protein (TIRG00374 family)
LTLSRALRILVAVALTAYFLVRAQPARVAGALAGADMTWVALAVGLVFVDRALMAQRWIALLVALAPGSRPPLAEVLRIFFVSTFIGSFMPSVAGDAYRAYSLARLHVRGAEAAASVFVDRMLGVLSIVIVGAVAAMALGREAFDRGPMIALAAGTTASALAAAAIFSERMAAAAQSLVGRIPNARARRLGAGLLDAVRRYTHHHGALVSVLLTSMAVQVLRVLQAWCLGRALGIPAPLVVYFIAIPVILLVMLLPVTVNGLGTGQMAFEALFGRVGVGSPEAFALSILFIALGVVGNLPGGLLYALGPRRSAEQIAP